MFLKAGFLALVSGLVLLFAQPALANGSQTYTDGTGENPSAADISAVKVDNDDHGKLTFTVSFANMPELAADAFLVLGFDTDRNARTGDPDGAEFLFVLDGSQQAYALLRPSGSSYEEVANADLDVRYGAGSAVVVVDRALIGTPAAFDFFAFSGKGPDGGVITDDAPEGSQVWSYELKFTPVIESVFGRFQPAQPRAGKAFALQSVQLRLENKTTVKPASVTCTAKLGGKTLKGSGPGGCRWNLPKNAKGKKLVIRVTATYQDAEPVTVSSSFTAR